MSLTDKKGTLILKAYNTGNGTMKYKFHRTYVVPMNMEHILKEAVSRYQTIKGITNGFIYGRNRNTVEVYIADYIDCSLLKQIYNSLNDFIKEEEFTL